MIIYHIYIIFESKQVSRQLMQPGDSVNKIRQVVRHLLLPEMLQNTCHYNLKVFFIQSCSPPTSFKNFHGHLPKLKRQLFFKTVSGKDSYGLRRQLCKTKDINKPLVKLSKVVLKNVENMLLVLQNIHQSSQQFSICICIFNAPFYPSFSTLL